MQRPRAGARDTGRPRVERTPRGHGCTVCQEARRAARGRYMGRARASGTMGGAAAGSEGARAQVTEHGSSNQTARRPLGGGRGAWHEAAGAAARHNASTGLGRRRPARVIVVGLGLAARSAGGGKGRERRPRARKKAAARAQRNGGGKRGRADILRSAERPGATVHSTHSGRAARGHRATERRTAPRASTLEPRYTIGGIRESATLSVAQPACSLLTQCVAVQCAPGSLVVHCVVISAVSMLVDVAVGTLQPLAFATGRSGRTASWTQSTAVFEACRDFARGVNTWPGEHFLKLPAYQRGVFSYR